MHNAPGWQTACSKASAWGMAMAFSVRTSSVSVTQPARAMSSQRPCRRVSDLSRKSERSMLLVGLCCRFIDAPGSCLHANCLCMQALLSCLAYYHMCVLKSLRESLRTGGFPVLYTILLVQQLEREAERCDERWDIEDRDSGDGIGQCGTVEGDDLNPEGPVAALRFVGSIEGKSRLCIGTRRIQTPLLLHPRAK